MHTPDMPVCNLPADYTQAAVAILGHMQQAGFAELFKSSQTAHVAVDAVVQVAACIAQSW